MRKPCKFLRIKLVVTMILSRLDLHACNKRNTQGIPEEYPNEYPDYQGIHLKITNLAEYSGIPIETTVKQVSYHVSQTTHLM